MSSADEEATPGGRELPEPISDAVTCTTLALSAVGGRALGEQRDCPRPREEHARLARLHLCALAYDGVDGFDVREWTKRDELLRAALSIVRCLETEHVDAAVMGMLERSAAHRDAAAAALVEGLSKNLVRRTEGAKVHGLDVSEPLAFCGQLLVSGLARIYGHAQLFDAASSGTKSVEAGRLLRRFSLRREPRNGHLSAPGVVVAVLLLVGAPVPNGMRSYAFRQQSRFGDART